MYNTEKSRKYYQENKDSLKEKANEYYKKNKEKVKKRGVEYRKNNKDKIKKKQENYKKRNAELEKIRAINLTDRYIRRLLVKNFGFKNNEITKELIDIKKTQIKILRLGLSN